MSNIEIMPYPENAIQSEQMWKTDRFGFDETHAEPTSMKPGETVRVEAPGMNKVTAIDIPPAIKGGQSDEMTEDIKPVEARNGHGQATWTFVSGKGFRF